MYIFVPIKTPIHGEGEDQGRYSCIYGANIDARNFKASSHDQVVSSLLNCPVRSSSLRRAMDRADGQIDDHCSPSVSESQDHLSDSAESLCFSQISSNSSAHFHTRRRLAMPIKLASNLETMLPRFSNPSRPNPPKCSSNWSAPRGSLASVSKLCWQDIEFDLQTTWVCELPPNSIPLSRIAL